MVENKNILDTTAYRVILERIIERGIIETVSGDIYISHSEIKYVLGCKFHLPKKSQLKIIKEFYDAKIIQVSKSPGLMNGNPRQGETFYCIKQQIKETLT